MYTHLELWMTENRITRKQLARVAQCSTSSVSRWINQGEQFSGPAIKLLRDKYHLTPYQVDAFFFGGCLVEEVDNRTEILLEALQEITAATTDRILQRGQRK